MQAPPIIPVAPTSGTPAAGSTQGVDAGSGEQFSTHLAAAGEQTVKVPAQGGADNHEVDDQSEQGLVDSATENLEGFSPLSADPAAGSTTEQIDIPEDPVITDELTQLATAESVLSLLTGYNLQVESQDIPGRPPGYQERSSGIQNMHASVQIPGTTIQQEHNEQPAALLNALLGKSLTEPAQTGQESPSGTAQVITADPKAPGASTATIPTQANNTHVGIAKEAGTGGNPTQPEVTIENWRAQFNYQRSTSPQEINNQKLSPEQLQYGGKGLVKEPVFAYAAPEVVEVTPSSQGRSSSSIDITAHQRQDTNNQFIHSNLPGFTGNTESEGGGNNGQQAGNGQAKLNGDNLSQEAQPVTSRPGSDTPLIFSLDQERPAGLQQGQPGSATQTLRLPSGTEIPHERIIDQVIDRFTMNRTLKSGAIAMKLHPAELGELRMEIKVEQDNIKAHITTQNPQVQEILDRHLPKLREALEQQGLQLDQMKVTVGADDSNGQLFQEHFNRQQTKNSPRSNSNQGVFSLDAAETAGAIDEESDTEQQNLNVLV